MRKTLIIMLLLSQIGLFAQNDVDIYLIARNTGEKTLSNGEVIRIFGFAEDLGSHPPVPGPTLVVREGDSVHIDLFNLSQGAPHTIHLHGLDVDQQNDGVPSLSFEIPHKEHGFYHFKAPHAGTYLYHCHVVSTIHVQAGMYGVIIVQPSDGSKTTWNGGLSYDREFLFTTSEIDTFWHQDSVLLHPHGPGVHQVEIPVYEPQFFLVNGGSDSQLDSFPVRLRGAKNENIYLRFANVGYYGNRIEFPASLNAQIISSDGRPLPSYETADSLVILPGERYGVIVNPTDTFRSELLFNYFDLNTSTVLNTQHVQVDILETVGIPELKSDAFLLAPNPFQSKLRITSQLGRTEKLEVEVLDMNGRIVHRESTELSPNDFMELLDIQESGLYIVKVLLADGQQLWTKKVLKL